MPTITRTRIIIAEAPELPPDILEQIFRGFDVRDLIRFKGVCKSWKSFISSDRFIKAHLNHSYNNDHNNNKLAHRRIVMSKFGHPYMFYEDYDVPDAYFQYYDGHVFGSSNGLVCIYASRTGMFVANPLTREVKRLQRPQITYETRSSFCWGFGYDSSTDDYKVVLGIRIGENWTFFQVLSLKSNTWKSIGEVNHRFVSRSGILCNGALHWFMNDHNQKTVILSFDLSKEEFKEIPQPDGLIYNYSNATRLGIIEECLCIFLCNRFDCHKWVLKNYNGEQSWELQPPYDLELRFDVARYLRNMKGYNRIKKSFLQDDIRQSWVGRYLGAPIFVQSLVSPHVNVTAKRKRQAKSDKTSGKLIKGDLLGPSARA